jgi:NADPH:quinone reductase-like Zn-dependent oxidoreductase
MKFEKTGLAKDVLFFAESEVPEILKGEVLVKVMARPLNPSDYMFIQELSFYFLQPLRRFPVLSFKWLMRKE